jgi:PKD repeat protein
MVPITFKVEKRAAPTLTFFSGASTGAAAGQWAFYSGGYVVGTGTGSSRTSTKNTVINFTATVTLGTAGLGSGVWCADCDF